jgi:amino acid permease
MQVLGSNWVGLTISFKHIQLKIFLPTSNQCLIYFKIFLPTSFILRITSLYWSHYLVGLRKELLKYSSTLQYFCMN